MSLKLTVATKGKLLAKTNFKNYDFCLNTYVGCQFGCTYCFVPFTIKDPDKQWGEFVRVREHTKDKLPKELDKGYVRVKTGTRRDEQPDGTIKKVGIYDNWPIAEKRLVIGTMTDPYQPVEKKFRITRTALEAIVKHPNQFQKVGIFTRSPLVLQDLELIKKLPNARVHFTVTPYPPEILRVIEPYSPVTSRRWEVVKRMKDEGLRVHVNVSPVMPEMSEPFVEEFVEKLIDLQVDEYFVDPMQPYSDSFESFSRACQTIPNLDWPKIERIMRDGRGDYLEWKADYYNKWDKARKKLQHKAPNQLPIWSDHEHKVWVDMRTGAEMNHNVYGDDVKLLTA